MELHLPQFRKKTFSSLTRLRRWMDWNQGAMFLFYASDKPMQCPFFEVIEGKGHEDIYASAREEIYRIRKGAGGNRRCWTAKRTIREASTPSSSVDSPTRDL